MQLDYRHLLPQDFSPQSRVWVYQSNRLFSLGEALQIEDSINEFCAKWHSHGADVAAYGNLFFGQFIVLMADETRTGVSGCSTDSSVNFIKGLGNTYNVDFFNRTKLAFVVKDKVEILPLSQVEYAVTNGFIGSETLYFNNLVQTKEELENSWVIPVKESWLKSRLKTNV